jgi:hypothetical protein
MSPPAQNVSAVRVAGAGLFTKVMGKSFVLHFIHSDMMRMMSEEGKLRKVWSLDQEWVRLEAIRLIRMLNQSRGLHREGLGALWRWGLKSLDDRSSGKKRMETTTK